MSEHTVRIENANRIQRILTRICEANLNVIIRSHQDPAIAVRGRASALSPGALPGLKIAGLSAPGVQHLQDAASIRVEFKGMSTQVAFDAKIIDRSAEAITITQPKVIYSTERRQSARFHTSVEHSAFVELSALKSNTIPTALQMPQFDRPDETDRWCRVSDVSEGGLCVISRFPSILTCINKGHVDENARLILPMLTPMPLCLETRWIKKIKERTNNQQERYARRALIGFSFKNPNEELVMRIRQFVRAMNLSQAI